MVRSLSIDSLAAVPWALDRQVLAELVNAAERGTFAASPRPPADARTQGIVAIIPIHGAIERRATFLGELFGEASIEALRTSFRAALTDPDVRGIVLSIDSPGGSVAGVTELAAEIREARRTKPVLAHVDTAAASAAYWLASQADEVVVTPSGQVGSVGVYAIHMDASQALANDGLKATIISAGEHKVEGNEFEPLSDEARAAMQERVNAFYDQFVGDVAKGRGVSVETVRSDYGQGRMLLAQDALKAGMVDAVDTLDGALRRVARLARGSMAAESEPLDEPRPFLDRITALHEDAQAVVAHAQVRMDLRAKEGRPGLSDTALASLRSIRDAINALLPVEPVVAQPPAVEPPPAVPVAASAPVPRFRSDDEWMQFLAKGTH